MSEHKYRLFNGTPQLFLNDNWENLLPSDSATTIRTFLRERTTQGPFTWFRRINKSDSWSLITSTVPDIGPYPSPSVEIHTLSPPSTPPTTGKFLYLIREAQAPGEPHHWSLLLAHENSAGEIFEVTGDAEHMTYFHRESEDRLRSENYADCYILADDIDSAGEEKVRECCRSEKPPGAVNRKSVEENCQGWCCRVAKSLEGREIVKEGKSEKMKKWLEPVRNWEI